MKIEYAGDKILKIDDARIVYRNFRGEGGKFNREGEKNFSLLIPDEGIAFDLFDRGWNVKVSVFTREDAERFYESGWPEHAIKLKLDRDSVRDPFIHLPIKVKFNERGPKVYLVTGRNRTTLSEETIGCLDDIDIISVDMDIRAFDWDVNGKSGRTAYLQSMQVNQEIDRFMARFAEEEYPEE